MTTGYNFYLISGNYSKSKKKLEKLDITNKLKRIIDKDILEKEIFSALESGGIIYCVKHGKEGFGCFIFEKVRRRTDEFKENARFSSAKEISGREECFIFELKHIYNTPELNEHMAELEKTVKNDIPDYFGLYDVSACIWNDKMLLRPEISYNYPLGLVMGITLGILFGWFIYNSIPLGLCLGIGFVPLFSSGYFRIFKNEKDKKFNEKEVK